MDTPKIFDNNLLNSYADANREKLDAALVSLRIVKQIDEFLDIYNLNQKDLAFGLGVSEAFVSQLMSGSKKINMQILSNFEKKFNAEFDFTLKSKDLSHKSSAYDVIQVVSSSMELKSFTHGFTTARSFCIINDSNTVYSLDTELNPIVITK